MGPSQEEREPGPGLLRASAAFALLPVMVAGVVPWLLSRAGAGALPSSSAAWLLALPGLAVLVASVVSFHRRGKGTLAPWDPPQRLVVQDLYRFNRNPMYVGVALIVLAWALATGSPWNWAWAFVVPLAFHLRVVRYEEPEMRRLFGASWEHYAREVPRWGVRARAYRSPSEAPGEAPGEPPS